eukprot:scaffold38673_cov54-Phaeocystis_antarctica.AAC.2
MGLPGAVQAGVRDVGRRGRQQAFSKTLNGLPRCGAGGRVWRGGRRGRQALSKTLNGPPRCDAGGRSGIVGICRNAGVTSSLPRKGGRSGRVGVQEWLWRRLARAPKAVAGRAVAWSLALGASSRPGPPGAPCGGSGADLGHCQGRHFDRAAMRDAREKSDSGGSERPPPRWR